MSPTLQYAPSLNKPVLLLSYDWERFGGEVWDTEEGLRERTNEMKGLINVIQTHKAFNKPLTLFVLGRLVELDPIKDFVVDLSNKFNPDFLDINHHSYSHVLIKRHKIRGDPVSLVVLKEEMTKAKMTLEKLTGRKCIGFRSPQGFHNGLQRCGKRLKIIYETGIRFISSDLPGPEDKFPGPWKNQDQRYRQPYWYANEGFCDLLEIPTQGFPDNILKGLSRTTIMKPAKPSEELAIHLEYFKVAIENLLVFAPLNHVWSIAKADPSCFVIKGLLEYAENNNVEVMNYLQFYEHTLQSMSDPKHN